MAAAAKALAWLLASGIASGLASGPAHAGKVHEHGAGKLNLVQDGPRLMIELELPLDTLVGFERAPRSPTERQAAQAALAHLGNPAALFRVTAPAPCEVAVSEIKAPVLEGASTPAGGHADAWATYAVQCAGGVAPTRVEWPIFDTLPRLKRLDTQASLPGGQRKLRLTPANRTIALR